MPFLEILNGPESGTRFDLDHDTIFLGRDPNNHCVLGDRTVSRKHAVINRSGETWVVSDLKSRKGILVNGEKVQETPLEEGDEITLGVLRLRFHLEEGSYQTPIVPIQARRSYVTLLLRVLFSLLFLGGIGFYYSEWGLTFPPSMREATPAAEVGLKEHYESGLRYFNEERDFESAEAEWRLMIGIDPEAKSLYTRKALKLLRNIR